jgi:hypothetical protein
MSLSIDKGRTEFFTVVGAPYVPEQHTDGRSHLQQSTDTLPPETGIAVLWVVAYVLIFGVSLFSFGGIGKAFEYAVAYLK